MTILRPLILLFSLSLALSNSAFAEQEEAQALSELKTFQWSNLQSSTPPCISLDCHLTWAALAMALGDAGSYARRVKADGMQQYANAEGIRQNFEVVEKMESLKPVIPWHIAEQYQVKLKNKIRKTQEDAADMAVDSRVFIEISVNNIPADVIFDTGATLTLPSGNPAATTLDKLDISANNKSGLGKVEINSLTTAKMVSVDGIKIENIMAKKKEGLATGDINAVGLFGYDLLLRFDVVNVDMRDDVIKFNPPAVHGYCAPMELVVDKNRLPAGLAVDLMIDDIPFKARIDTGANVDVVLHGKDVMPWKNGKPLNIMAIDSGGNTSPLEEFKGRISLDKKTPVHTILRTPLNHDEFKATLGVKFFIGHSFTFDFKHSQFCMD